jgi:hypothetical protein
LIKFYEFLKDKYKEYVPKYPEEDDKDDDEEEDRQSGKINYVYEPTSGAEATMPPPVQLTKRFQEPINYDSTLEMPSPPISPLKPYSYPTPSPPLDKKNRTDRDGNYPNVKFYQNHGFNLRDYSSGDQLRGYRNHRTWEIFQC